MTSFTGAWSAAEVREFLEGTAIPLRLACHTPGGGLWTVALWHRYRDGAFECATARDADVVGYLRENPGVAFDVSTNEPPYRGIRGSGTASLDPEAGVPVLRSLLERYLGGTDTPLAERLLAPEREETAVRIEPERVHSWDYTDRMGGG